MFIFGIRHVLQLFQDIDRYYNVPLKHLPFDQIQDPSIDQGAGIKDLDSSTRSSDFDSHEAQYFRVFVYADEHEDVRNE
jgi:hypothetical protein